MGAVETSEKIGMLRQINRFNSATAWEPWRLPQFDSAMVALALASIRPRHGSRGDTSPAKPNGGPRRRFNSATAWEPWRRRSSVPGPPRAAGFNSATAWEPWRPWRTPRPGSGDGQGFNSATAWEPWRHQGALVMPLSPDGFNSATAWEPWRPRSAARARRGGRAGFNSATAWEPWRPRGCGREASRIVRFNSATAWEPWRRVLRGLQWVSKNLLQFGHGMGAVETNKLLLVNVERGLASIRPRHGSRGDRACPRCDSTRVVGFNSATSWEPWRRGRVQTGHGRGGQASIRPRHGSRGDHGWLT